MATVGRIEMLLLGNGFGEAGSESRSAGRKSLAQRFNAGKGGFMNSEPASAGGINGLSKEHLCRPRGTRIRDPRPPRPEGRGYHLSRPSRWGFARLIFEERDEAHSRYRGPLGCAGGRLFDSPAQEPRGLAQDDTLRTLL